MISIDFNEIWILKLATGLKSPAVIHIVRIDFLFYKEYNYFMNL